jgi:hypothetical protein
VRLVKRGYTVKISMTPRQAIEAAHALEEYAVTHEHATRAYSASSRIVAGLIDDGWTYEELPTLGSDAMSGIWKKPA